jgi:hypothetical protein
MQWVLVILAALVTAQTVSAAYCHGKPSPDAHANNNPLYTKGTRKFMQ